MKKMAKGEIVSVRLRVLEKSIREQPLKALCLSAFAGFPIGGGYRSRLGRSVLSFLSNAAIRQAAVSSLLGAIENHDRSRHDRE